MRQRHAPKLGRAAPTAAPPPAAAPTAAPTTSPRPAESTTFARPPAALYVHVPFCISLCPYCDFVVYPGAAARGPKARVEAFLGALRTELELRADALDEAFGADRPPLESVYLGGGTPSLVPALDVAEIMKVVRRRYGVASNAEVTLEANPGPDERGDAEALRAAGVTRLSLGAQSMSDGELQRLGRRHVAADVRSAVKAARAGGIVSVSLDLLYDIPGSSLANWTDTLEAALDLKPDHLSLYALTLDDPDDEGLTGDGGDHLPTTAGARRWRERARRGQDEDRAAAQYHYAVHRLAADGWRGYEISNWARPGHESRHNLAYWERRPYEAVGPGAHAFDGVTRRWNAARLEGYLAALAPAGDAVHPQLPPGGSEPIDDRAAAAEAVILALRLDTGISETAASATPLAEHFAWALTADLVEITPDDRIVLTTNGRLLSNELFSRLI